MNIIYLMKDEKKDFALFKVGFTSQLMTRLYAYTTHNPLADCISLVQTKSKSKREIEKQFHKEIEKRGYHFISASIDNKKTEWFKVDYDDPFYKTLTEEGLQAFKCGKHRKDLKK